MLMQAAAGRANALTQELTSFNETVSASQAAAESDPRRAAMVRAGRIADPDHCRG